MLLQELSEIIRRAGDIILKADISCANVAVKSSPGDFITKYDVVVQDMLCDELTRLFPEAQFIGEESKLVRKPGTGYCFIVDPIDGTANFAWDYHHSAISIALACDNKIITGLVFNPYLNELFHAEIGRGAFLNGRPIQASHRALKEGLVCFGTAPYYKDKAEATFDLARTLYQNALDVRRSGSAALDICYIACGRCDLFYEMVLSPWDYAAASLIVKEAGGRVATLQGEELQFNEKTSLIAGSPQAFHDFWQLYK